jgi:hypothetical protein
MKRTFTKLLFMSFGLFLSAGIYAVDAYTPDLIWTGVAKGLSNVTDTVNGVAVTRNRRYLQLKDSLVLGGLVFNSTNAYTLGTWTTPAGNANVISGDFQMVQHGPATITMVGKGFTVANTQGSLVDNNSTLRVNGPGGSSIVNLIAETAFGPKVTLNNGKS